MKMAETLLSVGIDIGTSTTQLVFSKLYIENVAAGYSVPKMAITNKEIIYKSDIHFTPLKSATEIDADAVLKIILLINLLHVPKAIVFVPNALKLKSIHPFLKAELPLLVSTTAAATRIFQWKNSSGYFHIMFLISLWSWKCKTPFFL